MEAWWVEGVVWWCEEWPYSLQVVAQAGVFKMYSYEQLVDKCPSDVDPAHKEVRGVT